MDLSFLPELETLGTPFKNENNAVITNNYSYLAAKGVNLVRLRLWINHSGRDYDLTKVLKQAKLVKAAEMNFLLDFHYSDTWA
jgi:arabinogalactan endo-1,4-beta-galactosidase